MQFDGGAQRSGSESQRISLGSSPRAPFDDYNQPASEERLTDLPLQRLDPPAPFFIVEV
jgi:hypothetical protein